MTLLSNLNLKGSFLLLLAFVGMLGCQWATSQSTAPMQEANTSMVDIERLFKRLPPMASNPSVTDDAISTPTQSTSSETTERPFKEVDESSFTKLPQFATSTRTSKSGHPKTNKNTSVMNSPFDSDTDERSVSQSSEHPNGNTSGHEIPDPLTGLEIAPEDFTDLPQLSSSETNLVLQQPLQPTVQPPVPVPVQETGQVMVQETGQVTVQETIQNSLQADPTGSPLDNATWWKSLVTLPFGDTVRDQPVDANSLVYTTLQNSPRIRAVSSTPLIRDLQIIEADAEFDPISFVRSQFEDRYDPVGDALSGVPDGILKDNIWSADMGLRKKLRNGATYELGQRLGFKNSNSAFFTPNDQGTATLSLNVAQPLLRGGGRYYNQSQILIAQSASGAAWDTFSGELQDEIEETVKAYWRLYFDRSSYLQKQRNVERGVRVLQILEGRQDLDSLPSQITRARSAVQSRKTDLANALRDIRDAETEIRRLTADRNWRENQDIELLPTETPATDGIHVALDQVVLTAIEHRPEIKATMERAKIAGIRKDISENELLPELSFLLGTYVSGLEGESRVGEAIRQQWADTTPGYSVGFEFELPIRNRAACSRYSQRQVQLAMIKAEVDETMLDVVAESQIAWRQVTSAKQTLDAALQAIEAARADLEQNHRRWELFALIEGDLADGQTPTTMLDQLLDSQERLAVAELVYTQSELDLKTSEVALQRAMGTLLIHQNVSYGKTTCQNPPEMLIDQNEPVSVTGHAMPGR